jgi:hypothetical protein
MSSHPHKLGKLRSRRRRSKPSRIMLQPPQFASNLIFNHTYRFLSTSATPTPVTPTSLLCASGTICTVVNTDVASFWQSVKVNRIHMWTPPPAVGSSATCSIEWIGTSSMSNNKEVSDTSVSTAFPAHVHSSPPPRSLAQFWNQPSANAIFTLTAPVGTIIDVNVTLVAQDDNVTNAFSVVTTGALGVQYYLSLDSNATHRYTPISLFTTT